ncbi:MAG: hypothetical protein F6K56_16620 [Moorea sp. SIO3G5]|nr:hypothetical protein [Moorena sp. SIO3G5]
MRYTGFFPLASCLLPIASCLLPTPCSLLPTPYSLLPTPYSLFPFSQSLKLPNLNSIILRTTSNGSTIMANSNGSNSA